MQSRLSVSACRRHLPLDPARSDAQVELLRDAAYKMSNVIIALYEAAAAHTSPEAEEPYVDDVLESNIEALVEAGVVNSATARALAQTDRQLQAGLSR